LLHGFEAFFIGEVLTDVQEMLFEVADGF